MTLDEMRAILIPLALALRADFDGPTQRAYHRTLSEVPVGLLQMAADRAMKSAGRFMPTAAELRTFAEEARRAMRATLKFEPCVQCDETGWIPVEIDGVKRTKRCGCWLRHQEKVQALGVGEKPLALPEARDWTGDAA